MRWTRDGWGRDYECVVGSNDSRGGEVIVWWETEFEARAWLRHGTTDMFFSQSCETLRAAKAAVEKWLSKHPAKKQVRR